MDTSPQPVSGSDQLKTQEPANTDSDNVEPDRQALCETLPITLNGPYRRCRRLVFTNMLPAIDRKECRKDSQCYGYNYEWCKQANMDMMKRKPFKCAFCDICFATAGELEQHHKWEHNLCGRLTCPACVKDYKTSGNLMRHYRVKHTGGTSLVFPCHLCPKKFAWPTDIKRHLQEHGLS